VLSRFVRTDVRRWRRRSEGIELERRASHRDRRMELDYRLVEDGNVGRGIDERRRRRA
jgi:hypothetical protein